MFATKEKKGISKADDMVFHYFVSKFNLSVFPCSTIPVLEVTVVCIGVDLKHRAYGLSIAVSGVR